MRDFVNTVEWQVDVDQWESPADVESWFAQKAGTVLSDVSASDLLLLRGLREGLRALLLMNAGHAPLATSIDELNDALGRVPVRLEFDGSGRLRIGSNAGSVIAMAFALILDAVDVARVDGSWSRVKACSRDSCRWAYWDGSRNFSARWCSMAGCGNYVKMRRRNSPGKAVSDVIPLDGGASRAPTLLDVAGRAGVSIKTVSNVVTGATHVSDATRARVQAVIDDLGYEPNLAARALNARRHRR